MRHFGLSTTKLVVHDVPCEVHAFSLQGFALPLIASSHRKRIIPIQVCYSTAASAAAAAGQEKRSYDES